jgi:hypothetical protein
MGWYHRDLRSRIEALKRVARMLRAHEPVLLEWRRANFANNEKKGGDPGCILSCILFLTFGFGRSNNSYAKRSGSRVAVAHSGYVGPCKLEATRSIDFDYFRDLKLPGLSAFLGRHAARIRGERISQVWGVMQFLVYRFNFWNFMAYCKNPTMDYH